MTAARPPLTTHPLRHVGHSSRFPAPLPGSGLLTSHASPVMIVHRRPVASDSGGLAWVVPAHRNIWDKQASQKAWPQGSMRGTTPPAAL